LICAEEYAQIPFADHWVKGGEKVMKLLKGLRQ